MQLLNVGKQARRVENCNYLDQTRTPTVNNPIRRCDDLPNFRGIMLRHDSARLREYTESLYRCCETPKDKIGVGC
jgi:hypothetical protein